MRVMTKAHSIRVIFTRENNFAKDFSHKLPIPEPEEYDVDTLPRIGDCLKTNPNEDSEEIWRITEVIHVLSFDDVTVELIVNDQ